MNYFFISETDIDHIAKKFKENSDIILVQGDVGLEFHQNSDPHNSKTLKMKQCSHFYKQRPATYRVV